MKKASYLLIVLILLSSCIIQIVNGNEYDSLTVKQKGVIHKLESFDSLKPKHIYEITGKQLLEELKTKEKSLVYIFANHCTSKTCIPISTIENYAKENHLNFYPVMISYYQLDYTLKQQITGSLFSINNNYYNEKKERKYVEKFRKDIGYYSFSNNKYLGGYIYFKADKIIDIKRMLNE